MFEVFAAYLQDKATFTEAELQLIKERALQKKLRKGQYLLQEGDIARYQSFMAKGAARMYRVDENGTEHIMRFSIENWWVNDYESFIMEAPAKYNIDVLEDSELIQFSKQDFEELQELVPSLKAVRQKLDDRHFVASQNRILSNISDTAEQRYETFINTYPDIFNRVPLRMVASYLGLTRETLSRIRSQYGKAKKP